MIQFSPEPRSVRCRVRITGTYRGRPWSYVDAPDSAGSQFIQPDGDPSEFWWTEGNFSCDCNRSRFLPPEWGVSDDCGEEIKIDTIEPIDSDAPTLVLNESESDPR